MGMETKSGRKHGEERVDVTWLEERRMAKDKER